MLQTSAPLSLVERLAAAKPDLQELTTLVISEPELIPALFDTIESPPSACAKFAAAKLLQVLSEESPAALYPYFDSLVALLVNDNSIIRWNGIPALGNMGGVDTGKKLDRILEQYLAPIAGPQMIDAANTIRGATAIALAKPYLADRIARAIRTVERAGYHKPECRNVALGHAILALKKCSACCMISALRNCLFADSSVIREMPRGQRRASLRKSARLAKEVRLARVD
jgi:hypothetical protein